MQTHFVWEAGQFSEATKRDSDPDQVFLEKLLKKGRAPGFRLLFKGWIAKEDLVNRKGSEKVEGAPGKVSPTEACLMEEAFRYSIFLPPFVCVWGG